MRVITTTMDAMLRAMPDERPGIEASGLSKGVSPITFDDIAEKLGFYHTFRAIASLPAPDNRILARKIALELCELSVAKLKPLGIEEWLISSIDSELAGLKDSVGNDIDPNPRHYLEMLLQYRKMSLGFPASYKEEVEACAIAAIVSVHQPTDSDQVSDDPAHEGAWVVPDAISVLADATELSDPVYRAAAEVADIAISAEKTWQEGTHLSFQFCTKAIRERLDELRLDEDETTNTAEEIAWRALRNLVGGVAE